MNSRRILRFGVFEADLDARELRRRGVKIKLQDQPFQVLALLLERPREIVTREELQKAIWPEGTFVDFDHGLNVAVQSIRRALGDDASNPRFVETIPRRGYRFIAQVQPVDPPPPDPPPPPHPWWVVAARFSVVGTATVLGAFLIHRAMSSAPEVRLTSTSPRSAPITSHPGLETAPTFSPEGDRVAFAWEGPNRDNFDIHVRLIGQDTEARLTNSPAADLSPAWSPDGRRIAFVRHDAQSQTSTVILVPAIGGPERELKTVPLFVNPNGPTIWWASIARHLAWLPDGIHLVASLPETRGSPLQLYLLNVDTLELRTLLQAATLDGDYDPAVSPDGKRIAFRRAFAHRAFSVHVANMTDSLEVAGPPRNLTGEMMAISPAWTLNGREIIFSSKTTEKFTLWRVSVEGGPPRPIALPRGAAVPVLSAARDRLAVADLTEDVDIWQFELHGTVAKPLISSTYYDVTPMFSPDGAKIAFSSSRSGYREIWACNSDGSHPARLTYLESRQSASPFWSPDGSQIAFQSHVEDQREIFAVPAAGGKPRRLTTEPADDSEPTFSRDGQWIYFQSNRSGEPRIWKVPADGGEALPVTSRRGLYALESIDGQTLYISDGNGIWSMPIDGGDATPIVGEQVPPFFAVGRDGIYFEDRRAAPNLNYYDFSSGKVKQLLTLPRRPYAGVSVSPDGKKVLFTGGAPPESDIVLVEEFR